MGNSGIGSDFLKKGAIIGASIDSVHAIKVAQELGVKVFALDGNPEAEGFKYADEKIVVDISNQQLVAKEIEKIEPDFLIPVPIGRWLSTSGYINDRYNLPGFSHAAAEVSTDKYLFHKRLQEKNLRKIQAYLINPDMNRSQLLYPAIIKPRFGSGSRDVFWITNQEELDETIQLVKYKEEDFILEEAVEGIEYGVDGAVIEGKLYISLIREKNITPLPVRQAIAYISIQKSKNKELYKKVGEYLDKVVIMLQYNNCLIHADIIVKGDEVFIIEIAPRPSGHNLHNVFTPLASKVDLVQQYLLFLLNKTFCFSYDEIRCLQIQFFNFENVRIENIPSEEKLRNEVGNSLIKWNCNISNGEIMQEVINGHSIMGRGYFVVEGCDKEELNKKSQWIMSQFKKEII